MQHSSNGKELLKIWCDRKDFMARLSELIEPALSVMDIGCGIRPQQLIVPDFLICVEPHFEYANILTKNLSGTNSIVIQLDAKTALMTFPDRSVDTIFLMDVIEHMTKDIGLEVLKECERVARKQVVIFTPLGFMPQEMHAGGLDGWNLNGGTLQDHKSGWYPEDFPEWHTIACKDFCTSDFKGRKITPPYGSLLAVRSLPKSANCFNDLYAKEVIAHRTDQFSVLQKFFPRFIDHVVNRELEKRNLKCGLWSCYRTVELLLKSGSDKSQDEILELVHREKMNAQLKEAHEYIMKIQEFASEFLATNFCEAKASCSDVAKRKVTPIGMAKKVYGKIYRKLKKAFS